MEYEPIIGLEIHAQLKTDSKLFCSCKNDPESREPNTNICPVCTGMPGTLPSMNQEPLRIMIKVGLALNSSIRQRTKWDRKHYFYPDLPKGYQITQYDEPMIEGGHIVVEGKKMNIIRVHLEEDTGRLTHPKHEDFSLVDLNRAGTPLMELVTHPVFRSARECRLFAEELQKILRCIDASSADMENGNMRCDANISLRKDGEEGLPRYKVEIKNMNSFRSIEAAVEYEINRQSEVLSAGGVPAQETRGWDENAKMTRTQRIKETADDYRYFPEPDIPAVTITDDFISHIKRQVGPLPDQIRSEFADIIDGDLIENLILDKNKRSYIQNIKSTTGEKSRKVLNFFYGEIIRGLNKLSLPFDHLDTSELLKIFKLIESGKLPAKVFKENLETYLEAGKPADEFFKDFQVSNDIDIESIIDKIVSENPKAVEDFKRGKLNSIQFLAGQVLKQTRGFGDPVEIKTKIESKLNLMIE